MKIIHIADPHLGYRAYNRITSQGINRREADVFKAFQAALARAAEAQPDLILIAGDLFHVVRPSNLTIQHAFRSSRRSEARPKRRLLSLAETMTSPRSTDTGCILDLFSNLPDIYVAHGEYVQIPFKDLDTSVFCLCHRAIPQLSSLKIEPDPASKYNVLMVHGTLEGIIRHAYDLHEISRSQVISDAWDYIAFGHYHIFEELAPNAFYAGSLEYTSTNIWSEVAQEKGLIEYDLDEHRLIDFHKVPTREVIDFRAIDATGVVAADLSRMIEQRVESIPDGCESKIVRLVVKNITRSVQADLDFALVRKIRSEALHFELQLRSPGRDGQMSSRSESGVVKALEEEWEEFAKSFETPPGVERENLVKLGRDYLMKQAPVE